MGRRGVNVGEGRQLQKCCTCKMRSLDASFVDNSSMLLAHLLPPAPATLTPAILCCFRARLLLLALLLLRLLRLCRLWLHSCSFACVLLLLLLPVPAHE